MGALVKLGYSDPTSPSGWAEFASADGKLRATAQDYELAILEGGIDGHEALCLDGFAPVVNTANQTMWGVVPATQALVVFPAAAAAVTVVSSSSTDNQAGVGARSITITGLLAGYVASTEVLPLHATDGTVAVTSAKSWLRINDIEVASAGTGLSNAGFLTVKSGADIVQYVGIGSNKSIVGIYTVAAGHTAYLTVVKGTGAGTKNVHVHLFTRVESGLFVEQQHRTVNNSSFEFLRMKLVEKTDLHILLHADVSGGIADIGMTGWIEENAA